MGTGLIWGNTVTGYAHLVSAHNDRSDLLNGDWRRSHWGACGKSLGPSAWDENVDANGHACLDQIGRGAGDLLAGPFGSIVNTVSGTISWPHEAQEPVYAWQNTVGRVLHDSKDAYWMTKLEDESVISKNRDYYLEVPNVDEPNTSFNGTAGIGYGLLSARPAACTPLVAYWATDTNSLYQCSTKNSWVLYYTPYTYPHPLQGTVIIRPKDVRVTAVH